MTIVWILSYLAVFMLGSLSTFAYLVLADKRQNAIAKDGEEVQEREPFDYKLGCC